MKWIFSITSICTLFLCCTDFSGGAEAVQLSSSMDKGDAIAMQIQLANGFTVVSHRGRTLYIDYDNGALYNHFKDSSRCTRFDITPLKGDAFTAAQINIFGELKIVEVSHSEVGDARKIYTVMNAPRAMMIKGVAASTLSQFGQEFTPGFTEYLVDTDHEDFQQLLKIAEYNRSKSKLNPLLDQLDESFLIDRFTGVPLQKREKDKVTELIFSIENEQALRTLLPSECL